MDDIQSWWEVPSIAHFCSLFRAAFNLLDFDIEELEEALLTDGAEDAGSSLLQELMVRLLCGCISNGHDISVSNYQMFLRRLFRKKCEEYGRSNPFNTDIDFQFLPLRTKVEILHALCDFRLDGEDVQDLLKNLESESLRVESLGQDVNCSVYWYFYGTRLYREDFPKVKKKSRERKRGRKKELSRVEDDEEEDGESRWTVVCYTEQDWEALTTKLQDSRDPAEKALYHTLAVDFLPEIPRLFAEKERLQMKRLMEYQPRRTSSRIKQKEKKEAQQEQRGKGDTEEEGGELRRGRSRAGGEEERSRGEAEEGRRGRSKRGEDSPVPLKRGRKPRVEDDETRSSASRENANKKENKKERKERVANKRDESEASEAESVASSARMLSSRRKPRSTPAPLSVAPSGGRQTNNSLACATGPIFIQAPATTTNNNKRKLRSSQVFAQSEEDLQTGMYKILERLKTHPDAWPFTDPVEEEYAPRYYAIVSQPMDLQCMEDKLDSGRYLTFGDFKTDFKLIVTNCKKYNGHENEYTEMVENLEAAFERAAKRYLECDFSTDEEVAIEFPQRREEEKEAEAATGDAEEFRIPSPAPSNHTDEKSASPEPPVDRGSRSRGGIGRRGKRKAEVEEERRGRRKRGVEGEREDGRKHRGEEDRKHRGEEDKKHRGEEDKKHRGEDDRKHRGEDDRKHRGEDDRKHRGEDDKKHRGEEEKRHKGEERKHRGRRRKPLPPEEDSNDESASSDSPLVPRPASPKAAPPPVGPYGRRRAGPPPKPVPPRKAPERRRHSSEEDEEEPEGSDGDRENKAEGSSRKREAGRPAGNARKRKKTGGVKNTAAIEALELATEQTLKDINKWLDDTPRFSEFSSASNSPTHYLGNDESAIEREYRRSLKMGDTVDKKEDDTRRFRTDKRKPKPSHTSSLEALRDKRKKDVQRTVERMQPGKSKGNLISNLPKIKSEDTGDNVNNVIKSNKEKANALVLKGDETQPKLSLGSVLKTRFGFGGEHTFTEKTSTVVEKEIKEEKPPKSPEKTEIKTEDVVQEEKKVPAPSKPAAVKPVADSNKATPNLSAWFKAFGAPKAAPPKKKAEVAETAKPEPLTKPVVETIVQEPLKSPSKSPEAFQTQTNAERPSRHRNLSTGSSSVSELSAFSQDIEMSEVASPRDRLAYHQSPPALSPSSPRPPPPLPQSQIFPLNGTIKVGFYQDTSSQKSSPDKGSPREEPVTTPTPQVPIPQTTPTYPQYTPPPSRTYPTVSNPAPAPYENLPAATTTITTNPQFHPSQASVVKIPPQHQHNPSDFQYYDTSKPLTDQYRDVVSHRTNPSPPMQSQPMQLHPEYPRSQSANPPLIPQVPTTMHHHPDYQSQSMQPGSIHNYPPGPMPPSYLTSNAPIKPNPMIIPQPPMRNIPNNLIIPQSQTQNPQPDPKIMQQYPVKKRMVYNTSEVLDYPPMDMSYQNQQRLVHHLPPYYDPTSGAMLHQPPYDLTTPSIKDTPPQQPAAPPAKPKRGRKKANQEPKVVENIGVGTAFQQYVGLSKDPSAISLKTSSVPGSAFNFGTSGLAIPTGHPLYNTTDKDAAYYAGYRNFYDNKLKPTQVSPQSNQSTTQPPQQQQQQQQQTSTQQCIGGPTSPQSPFSFLGQPPTASRAPHHQNTYQQNPPTSTSDQTPTYHQFQQMDQKTVAYYHHQFSSQSHPSLATTFAPPYSPSPPQQVNPTSQNPQAASRPPPHPFMVDSSMYQQYFQRHQEELLLQAAAPQRHPNPLLHQGLLGPPTGYPPGPYHPSLGIRQPFDPINRTGWM